MKKILIVDDSRTARMMIIQALENAGFSETQFREAEDGLAAVDLVHRESFDLIITDILMPKMDGNTFIRKARLQTINKETPILILSSLSQDGMDQDIFNSPGVFVLQKPLKDSELKKFLGAIHG